MSTAPTMPHGSSESSTPHNVPLPQGFCYLDSNRELCPVSGINLFTLTKEDLERSVGFLEEASDKLKSVAVCRQVVKQVQSATNILESLHSKKRGTTRKVSIRFVSTHGLEYFSSSVPLRYGALPGDDDYPAKQIALMLRSCPFNVCINVCTWISPTNLRRVAVSGNLGHFANWCMSDETCLQNLDIADDVKDKAFALFGETSLWPPFYAEWRSTREPFKQPITAGLEFSGASNVHSSQTKEKKWRNKSTSGQKHRKSGHKSHDSKVSGTHRSSVASRTEISDSATQRSWTSPPPAPLSSVPLSYIHNYNSEPYTTNGTRQSTMPPALRTDGEGKNWAVSQSISPQLSPTGQNYPQNTTQNSAALEQQLSINPAIMSSMGSMDYAPIHPSAYSQMQSPVETWIMEDGSTASFAPLLDEQAYASHAMMRQEGTGGEEHAAQIVNDAIQYPVGASGIAHLAANPQDEAWWPHES